MAEDLFLHGLQYIGSLLNVIIIPLATIIVGRKLLKEKKETGKLNEIRASTFFIFFSYSFLVLLEFLIRMNVYETPDLANFFGVSYDNAHRALADVHITHSVLTRLLKLAKEQGINSVDEIFKQFGVQKPNFPVMGIEQGMLF